MKRKLRKTLAVLLTLSICFNTINIETFAEENATETLAEQAETNVQEEPSETETQEDITETETQPNEDETISNNDAITEDITGWDGVTTESIYEGKNFKVIFSLTGYWNGGYNANVKIENTGKTVIENWILEFDYNGTISNIWNATINKRENEIYIIKNNVWNQDIAVGSSIEFGISGQEDFPGFPQKYNLLGSSSPVAEEAYSIEYRLDSDWGDGFTGSISITNNMDAVIEDWGLEFDYDRQITNMWNASIESHDGNHYVIKNAGYNSNIGAGANVSFGFSGTDGSSGDEPYNYKMISISLSVPEDDTEIDEDVEIDETLDTDNDGVPDYLEDYFGTNKNKQDTDGDGLSDYIELFLINLDPTMVDTDENGINDGDEDADKDGLTNLYELKIGTDLTKADSDSDGLSDSEEVNIYGTDPLNYDTDGDGVSDGKEVELGTNPLVAEDEFFITAYADDEDNEDTVEVSVEITLSGDQVESLSVERYKNEFLFPETMPGYIGGAYNFSVDGSFEEATLKFEFDKKLLADSSFDPVIYYFNEEEQLLEELDTIVVENMATAVTSHFSKYILINRKVYQEAFTWQDVWNTTGYSGVEIILVMDDSGSMTSTDKNNQRLAVAQNLIDKLPDNSKIGIIKFETSTSKLTPALTDDKEKAKSFLSTSYFKSSGGTNMYTAIEQAFTLFEAKDETVLKTIVVLSDGITTDWIQHASVITLAHNNNTKIHTIGLGNSNSSYFKNYLQPLANDTSGSFYLASNADELADIFNDINKKIDIETDSDGDGISDYYEENMVMFNGVTIKLDKNNPDSDGDGLLDGEEVAELNYEYNDDRTQVIVTGKLLSNPLEPDSDYDGKPDVVDTAPLDNHFTGTLSSTYKKTHLDSDVAFSMDYRWFFNDNSIYNKDLSIISILFASAAYHTQSLSIKDVTGKDTTAGESITDILDYFGFNNTQAIPLSDIGYSDHLSEVGLGYRTVYYNGQTKNIIAVIVRGTNGTISEWSSNFDIGNINEFDSEPDWVNVDNHKGFDIAANRIMQCVNKYVSDNELEDCVYWITGHSRGAAISNIIGAEYEASMKTAFTYAFATPNTTMDSNAQNYKTIFNIVNADDFVPNLPMTVWGYTKYGKTASSSIAKNYEKAWENLTNVKDYDPDTFGLYNTITEIGYIIYSGDAREEAYKYTCKCHGDGSDGLLNSTTATFRGMSEGHRKTSIATIPENALPYCKITTYEQINLNPMTGALYLGWNYDICQMPAYFMQILAAQSSGIISIPEWLLLDMSPRYQRAKVALTKSGAGGLKHPHYTESYYVLANNITSGGFN